MSVELAREAPLFDRPLNFQLVQGVAEPRIVTLVFRVLSGTRSTVQSAAGQSERLFHFEVTDDNDPYFLYLLDVGEHDFHLLKRDQSLLVEFNVFPTKLIELVEQCFAAESQAQESGFQSYMPKLDLATGVLSVVETNMFKQLTHISLQLRPGNDAAIKAYLASRLSLTLAMNRRMTKDLEGVQEILNVAETQKEEIANELQEIRTHKDVEQKTLKSQHTQEVSQMQMTMMSNMEQMREKYEAQLEGARSTIDTLQSAAKVKADEVLKLTTDLQHEKGHLEFRERELMRLLESADADRDRISHECKETAVQKRQVEEERGNLERELARSGAKVEALLQQVLDRDEMMVKQLAVQRAGEDSRKILQEKLDMYITNGEALQEKLRESGAEMTRGNALISRLQAEVKQLRDKSKAKSDVITRQEETVQELRSKVAEMERQALFEKDATLLSNSQVELLKKQLDESNEKLREGAKLISSNQEVIAYLNEEINKWQLGLRSGGEVYAVTSTEKPTPTSYSSFNVVTYSPDGANAHSTSAQNLSSGSAGPQFDKDVFMRGVRNLGLGDSFVAGASGLTSGDLGLESFEYYAAAEAPLYAESSRGQSKSRKQYAWQAEDFGLEDQE